MSNNSAPLQRIVKVGQRITKGFEIDASVGEWNKGAKNDPADVETIQLLLELVAKRIGNKAVDPRGVDGKISRTSGRSNTVKAIRAFQKTIMNHPDGLVEPKRWTVKKLRVSALGSSPKGSEAGRSMLNAPQPGEGLPAWLAALSKRGPMTLLPGPEREQSKSVSIAEEELKKRKAPAEASNPRTIQPAWLKVARNELDTKEILGKRHNPRIVEYHATTKKAKTDENPWCASFVNWVLEQAGYEGRKSPWSHHWRNWGDPISKPAMGCVAFIDWGKVHIEDKGKGHVGFVVGKARGRRIVLLGGNQSDRVRYSAFKKSLIVAYRVPKGFAVHESLYDLPLIRIKKGGGGLASTR